MINIWHMRLIETIVVFEHYCCNTCCIFCCGLIETIVVFEQVMTLFLKLEWVWLIETIVVFEQHDRVDLTVDLLKINRNNSCIWTPFTVSPANK